jgi:hypothetical protein
LQQIHATSGGIGAGSFKNSNPCKPYNPYDDPKHVVRQPFEAKKREKLAGA